MSDIDHSECRRNRRLAYWAMAAAIAETAALFFFPLPDADLRPVGHGDRRPGRHLGVGRHHRPAAGAALMWRLLKIIPGWGWVALAAAVALALGWLQLERLGAERDALAAELRTSQAEAAALDSALRWRREQAQHQAEVLEQRQRELDQARNETRDHREALARLEAEHAEVREWLDRDLPSPVADWLRAAPDPHGDGADRRAAGGPDASD